MEQKRVIGYIRVSSNQQDAERQKLLIERYCEDNGYNLIDVLKDEGISGAIKHRPSYLKLLQLTKEETDIVIVSELSRLSRQEDIIATLSDVNSLLQRELDIIFIDNNSYYKGGKPLELVDIMRIAIAAEYAKEERKKITQRMLSGLDRAFMQSDDIMLTGSAVPYGYCAVSNPNFERGRTPKTLLRQDETADVVRQIYQWCIEGLTVRKIQQRLIAKRIKTKKGEDFALATITHILHSPIYKGVWTLTHNRKKTDKEGNSIEQTITKNGDAIVSEEIWDKAQMALKQNAIIEIRCLSHFNPLKGILKCPCGKNLYITAHTQKLRFYRCAVKKNKYDETICANGGVNVDLALRIIWHVLKTIIAGKEFEQISNEKIQIINSEISEAISKIQFLNESIRQIKIEQENLLNNMGKLTNPEILLRLQNRYEEQSQAIISKEKEIELLKIERQKKEETKNQLSHNVAFDALDKLSIEDKAQLFKKYLEKVVYYSERLRRGFFVVTFKNGIETIVCIHTNNKMPLAIELPSTFKFDVEQRKILMPILPKNNENIFDIPSIEYKPLSAKETEDLFGNNEEYLIADVRNYPYFE